MYKDPKNMTEKNWTHPVFLSKCLLTILLSLISAALYDNKFGEFYPEILKSTEVSFRRLSEQSVLFRIEKCKNTNSQSEHQITCIPRIGR